MLRVFIPAHSACTCVARAPFDHGIEYMRDQAPVHGLSCTEYYVQMIRTMQGHEGYVKREGDYFHLPDAAMHRGLQITPSHPSKEERTNAVKLALVHVFVPVTTVAPKISPTTFPSVPPNPKAPLVALTSPHLPSHTHERHCALLLYCCPMNFRQQVVTQRFFSFCDVDNQVPVISGYRSPRSVPWKSTIIFQISGAHSFTFVFYL